MKRILLYLVLGYMCFAIVALSKDFNTFQPSLFSDFLAFGIMFPLGVTLAYLYFVRTNNTKLQSKSLYLRWSVTLMFGVGVAMFLFSYLGALNRQFPMQLLDAGKMTAYECKHGSSSQLYRYMRITVVSEGEYSSHYYLPYDFCDGSSDLTIVKLLNNEVVIYGHRSIFGVSFAEISSQINRGKDVN
jgi:hypothetical protein